ncbi:MAG: hypothetical protein ACXWUX_04210 [Allosphingosinicella sp.]
MKRIYGQGRKGPIWPGGAVTRKPPKIRGDVAGRYSLDAADILPFVGDPPAAAGSGDGEPSVLHRPAPGSLGRGEFGDLPPAGGPSGRSR